MYYHKWNIWNTLPGYNNGARFKSVKKASPGLEISLNMYPEFRNRVEEVVYIYMELLALEFWI